MALVAFFSSSSSDILTAGRDSTMRQQISAHHSAVVSKFKLRPKFYLTAGLIFFHKTTRRISFPAGSTPQDCFLESVATASWQWPEKLKFFVLDLISDWPEKAVMCNPLMGTRFILPWFTLVNFVLTSQLRIQKARGRCIGIFFQPLHMTTQTMKIFLFLLILH